jgi:hypothetical protein
MHSPEGGTNLERAVEPWKGSLPPCSVSIIRDSRTEYLLFVFDLVLIDRKLIGFS